MNHSGRMIGTWDGTGNPDPWKVVPYSEGRARLIDGAEHRKCFPFNDWAQIVIGADLIITATAEEVVARLVENDFSAIR